MSVFEYLDYRKFISSQIQKKPNKGHGEISRIAKSISVHQTLVSMVLAGERDLSLEQGFDLAMYLGLTPLEREYFSQLIQYARAGNQRYKSAVREKIEELRAEANQLSKRVEHEKVLSDQQRTVMYSSWVYSAVLLFASTSEKGKTLEEIQARFTLPRPQVVGILNFLESAGLVEKSGEHYLMVPQMTFLEHGSPHLLKHHTNWRIKALSQIEQISESELMFTSPVSLSRQDFKKLREELAEYIKGFLATVKDSPADELACLNIDFFWI
jgi:uncharacterized protein (TIGR02147 family)